MAAPARTTPPLSRSGAARQGSGRRGLPVVLVGVSVVQGENPTPGGPASRRGVPLASRDVSTRAAIEALHGVVDTAAVIAVWHDALRVPSWPGPPVWLHGDLLAGNVLCVDGRLSAVIDFGSLGVGDPACDTIAAWSLLPAAARPGFREALSADEDSWARGRGWALSIALIQLPYYQHTNPALAAEAGHTIDEIVAEWRRSP